MAEPIGPGERIIGWLSGLGRLGRAGLAIAAGLAIGAGQPPLALLPLALAGLVLAVLLLVRAGSAREALLTGWLVGAANFGLSMSWLVEPFLVDAARHGWMAPFAVGGMAGGLALFWAAAFWAAWRFAPSVPGRALVWPAAMALAELARGYVLGGFPWGLIGYLWSETPALNLASAVGAFGLSVLTCLGAALVAWGLIARGWGGAAAGAVLLALFLPAGAALRPDPADLTGRPMVRLVQPNAAQHQKWDPDYMQMFYDRQLAYTAAPATPRPALTIWPETAIPWRLEFADEALAVISEQAGGRPVVLGARRRDDAGLAYNSLVLIGERGEVRELYDKSRLVPFGEFIPLGGVTRAFGFQSFASRDGFGYTPGPGPRTLAIPALGRALPLICYEAIFPQAMGSGEARPEFLLQITNDAWFGTASGPYQHLAQARTRAIEQGLPLVRVANTGISAMIDPGGRVLAHLPLGEPGYLDAALPAAVAAPLYTRTGDLPILVFGILGLVVGGLLSMRRNMH